MEELPRELFIPGGLWVLSTTPSEESPERVVGNTLTIEDKADSRKNYLPVFTSDRLARGFLDHIPEKLPDEYGPLTYDDLAKFRRLILGTRHLVHYLVIDPATAPSPEAISIDTAADAILHHLKTQTD